MEQINHIFDIYNTASKDNPLLGLILIPIIGGIIFYLKSLPGFLWDLLVRNVTVTMTLNNAGYDGNADAYTAFDRWFMSTGSMSFSRNFFLFRGLGGLNGTTTHLFRIGVGVGTHIFFYKRKLFWFTKSKLVSTGSAIEKEEVNIRTFGWGIHQFREIVEIFNKKLTEKNGTRVHKWNSRDGSWEHIKDIVVPPIDTFIMNEKLKETIVSRLAKFYSAKEWYANKGLTYKISSLFFGPAGTGKTSLTKHLANHFDKDLYILDLTDCSNETLVRALSYVKPGSMLLMEDIDQAGTAVTKRSSEKSEDSLESLMTSTRLTMAGVLNAFDGILPLHDIVIIMTTNHPELLDPAIRRKSRIDNEYEIDYLTEVEIIKFAEQMYSGNVGLAQLVLGSPGIPIALPGCEVENAFKDHSDSQQMFLMEIMARSTKFMYTVTKK